VPGMFGRLRPFERAGGPPSGSRRAGAAAVALGAVALILGVLLVDRFRASMWTLQGQGAFYAGEYKAALQADSQPPVLRSPEHLPRVQAGSSCLRLGRYDDAVREFGATLRRSPYFIAAYLGRAAAEEEQGHWDLADADYLAAARIWPKNSDIYM